MLDLIIAKLQNIHIFLPAVIIALSFHELSHGYAAFLLGDDTAKRFGRLTLNPLAHLDALGTLALLFLPFGWAKPVPINPYNFKNYKAGTAITAAAGPASNFILAVLFSFLLRGYLLFTPDSIIAGRFGMYLIQLLIYIIQINLVLGIFNLIPFPPLDGSKILGVFLPNRLYNKYMVFQQNGFKILMVVMLLNFVFRLNIFYYIIRWPLNLVMPSLIPVDLLSKYFFWYIEQKNKYKKKERH